MRVSRPAKEKMRCLSVLVVITARSPSPMRAVQLARLCAIVWTASQAASGCFAANGVDCIPEGAISRKVGLIWGIPDYWNKSARAPE